MIPIFIVSNRNYSGKTFIALGLALKLTGLGYKVGYIKPLGKTPVKKGRDVFDSDALFMKEALSLPDPMNVVSPFMPGFETQELVFGGKTREIKKRVLKAFRSLRDKDFVFIGGAADIFDGATLNLDAVKLIEDMEAHALIVEAWDSSISIDSLFGLSGLMGKRCAGGIVNKVPVSSAAYVNGKVKPFLEKKGVRIFGVFEKDTLLESCTVRDLNEALNGKVLCCKDGMDEPVENFSIGAMDVDSALSYFRRTPNKAVITGAHRSDIQLAALETSTKCIILTGGLYTNDVVIGKAESKGIPVISVTEDTFTTLGRIESVTGRAGIRGERKIERAKAMIDSRFDMKGFLKSLK